MIYPDDSIATFAPFSCSKDVERVCCCYYW